MRNAVDVCVLCAVAAVIGFPVQARAEGYITPWIGLSVATATDNGRSAFGVTTGYMGAGVFGFEADIGYSPQQSGVAGEVRTASGITALGNFILGVPIGGTHGAGVRPFVTGGLGMTRTQVEFAVADPSRSNNAFDYNLGVGMMGFFSHHFGLRGDVRYLRTLRDTDLGGGLDFEPARLRYWRATAGVTFR